MLSHLFMSVGWGCRIHWLNLCRGVRPPPPRSVLDITLKPSNGQAPAVEIWRMGSSPSLLLFPGSHWPRVVTPDRVLSMGQIEQNMCANKWLMLNCVCYIPLLETIWSCAKRSSGSFKNVICQTCLQIIYIYIYIYIIYLHKHDWALNNLQWLIWHKTQPNQTKVPSSC